MCSSAAKQSFLHPFHHQASFLPPPSFLHTSFLHQAAASAASSASVDPIWSNYFFPCRNSNNFPFDASPPCSSSRSRPSLYSGGSFFSPAFPLQRRTLGSKLSFWFPVNDGDDFSLNSYPPWLRDNQNSTPIFSRSQSGELAPNNFRLQSKSGIRRSSRKRLGVVNKEFDPPLGEDSAVEDSEQSETQFSQLWISISHLVLPRYLWRAIATIIMAGQVVLRTISGRIHWKNLLIQLNEVGPRSVGVSLLTACFVGMAFTIQFVREFTRLGLTRSVGGVLSLALSRELSPVVTAIIMAGRVGSAFAAELGTMQVSEQTDTLRVLRTDPVDYLVTPRVISCCIALPVLTLLCFTVGMASSVLLAEGVYNVSANVILDSAARALQAWDIVSMMIKSIVFGGIISSISCGWGITTSGGAKGVGESTTSAVVISLVCVFIADFVLSWCFFQGAGDALKAAMG